MKHVVSVVIIITFLPNFLCTSPELRIVNKLNDAFKFDHIILLLESSSNVVTSFARTTSHQNDLLPQTIYAMNFTNINTQLQIEISSKNTFVVVGLKDSTDIEKKVLLLDSLMKMQRQQINIKIGIFFKHLSSTNDLTRLFAWCKEHVIVHVLVATYAKIGATNELLRSDELTLFALNFFGAESIVSLTHDDDPSDFFPNLKANFQQHQLRVGVLPANVAYVYIWLDIFRLMNASFIIELVDENSTNYDELLERGIDIIPAIFTQEFMHNFHLYPAVTHCYGIIVPFALPYPDFFAYLKIVTSDCLFLVSFIAIAIAVVILIVSRWINRSKITIFQSLLDVASLILNKNDEIRYGQLSVPELFVVVPFTFMGLVFVSGVLSHLQSHVTRPFLQPQIQTLDDIYDSPFQIVTSDESWKSSLTEALNIITSRNWSDKVIAINKSLSTAAEWFNFSMPFLLSNLEKDIGFKVQERLQIKRYNSAHLQVLKDFCYVSLLNDKFVFFDRFNEIINQMKSSGLTDYLQGLVVDLLVNDLLKRNRERNIEILNVETFDVSMDDFPMFVVHGWIASVLVFIVEIMWTKYKRFQAK